MSDVGERLLKARLVAPRGGRGIPLFTEARNPAFPDIVPLPAAASQHLMAEALSLEGKTVRASRALALLLQFRSPA